MSHFTFQLVSPGHLSRFEDYFAAHRGFYRGQDSKLGLLARMQVYDIQVLVAYQNGRPLGYKEFVYEPTAIYPEGRWVRTTDYWMRTVRMTVATAFQGMGVASMLNLALFDRARREGITDVFLHNLSPVPLKIALKLNDLGRRFQPFQKGILPPRKETMEVDRTLAYAPHVRVKIHPNPVHPAKPRMITTWHKPWMMPM